MHLNLLTRRAQAARLYVRSARLVLRDVVPLLAPAKSAHRQTPCCLVRTTLPRPESDCARMRRFVLQQLQPMRRYVVVAAGVEWSPDGDVSVKPTAPNSPVLARSYQKMFDAQKDLDAQKVLYLDDAGFDPSFDHYDGPNEL